ncbi:hypothetical protein D3C79_495910 [compost metagenome]
MHVDDLLQGVAVGEGNVVEEAAAQERVRQLFLVVGGDDDDRALPGLDGLVDFVDVELHLVEFLQQVVGELDIGLVDLVDQQDHPLVGLEGFPELALLQVVAHIVDFFGAQLRIAQAADRVVLVQALVSLGGGLDMPGDQACAEGGGELFGEHGLAGAGFAFDQQRALQGDGCVDRQFQVVCGDVVAGAFELHGAILCARCLGPAQTPPVDDFAIDYNAGFHSWKRRPGIQSLNGPSRRFSRTWAPAVRSEH